MTDVEGGAIETINRPPFLLRVYSFLTFPYSREGSLVWWWRMHVETHAASEAGCPYCPSREPADSEDGGYVLKGPIVSADDAEPSR